MTMRLGSCREPILMGVNRLSWAMGNLEALIVCMRVHMSLFDAVKYAIAYATPHLECDVRAEERHMYSDRKSTRLNSSHPSISYAVFCLKKKKTKIHLML